MNAERCPACKAPALYGLTTLPFGALACDACGGFWLDTGARPFLVAVPPLQTLVDNSGRVAAWTCPRCGLALRPQVVRGPTHSVVGVCPEHGQWFERPCLSALQDAELRAQLAQAIVSGSPRLSQDQRGRRLQAIGAVLLAKAMIPGPLSASLARPLGNPEKVRIAFGPVADGVTLLALDGSARVLVTAFSRWRLTLIVALVLGVLVVVIPLVMGLSSGFGTQFWAATGVVLFTFFVGTGLSAVTGVVQERYGVIVDARTRTIAVLRNRQLALSVPFELAVATRVQLFVAHPDLDTFDVLINLGFAELWMDQAVSRDGARRLAILLGETLGVPFDPEEQRK